MTIYTMLDLERFWRHVSVGKPDDCWEWMAAIGSDGYGSFNFDGRVIHASRFSFWIHTGIWPGDLFVCHSCDNKPCVNPRHLWMGTPKDNAVCGERLGSSKLTADEVREIRSRYNVGSVTQQQLAREYGVSQTCIHYIVNRVNWKHINVEV